jgi:hypothetical protein
MLTLTSVCPRGLQRAVCLCILRGCRGLVSSTPTGGLCGSCIVCACARELELAQVNVSRECLLPDTSPPTRASIASPLAFLAHSTIVHADALSAPSFHPGAKCWIRVHIEHVWKGSGPGNGCWSLQDGLALRVLLLARSRHACNSCVPPGG